MKGQVTTHLGSAERLFCSVLGLIVVSACASANDDDDDPVIGQASAHLDVGPNDLVIENRRFVREDTLTAEELKELQDPALWSPPETVEKLAQLLRAYVLDPKYGPYVEAEPNYELARISLGLAKSPFSDRAASKRPSDGTVEKTVSSNGDQRAEVVAPTQNPGSAIAMSEYSGSGVNLAFAGAGGAGSRIYTAGHVLYNNAKVPGANGWNCANGSSNASGCSSPTWNARFRFGGRVNTATVPATPTWAGGFVGCGTMSVPNGWVNMASSASIETLARYDYGRVNMDACVPAGTSAMGWWVSTQAELRPTPITAWGYPLLRGCPALANGVESGSDCGLFPITEVLTIGSRPFTGGTVIVGEPVTDTALTQTNGYIKTRKVDTTAGNSGGPLGAWDTATSNWYVVGVDSAHNDDGLGTNYFNSLTWEVVNFVLQ